MPSWTRRWARLAKEMGEPLRRKGAGSRKEAQPATLELPTPPAPAPPASSVPSLPLSDAAHLVLEVLAGDVSSDGVACLAAAGLDDLGSLRTLTPYELERIGAIVGLQPDQQVALKRRLGPYLPRSFAPPPVDCPLADYLGALHPLLGADGSLAARLAVEGIYTPRDLVSCAPMVVETALNRLGVGAVQRIVLQRRLDVARRASA